VGLGVTTPSTLKKEKPQVREKRRAGLVGKKGDEEKRAGGMEGGAWQGGQTQDIRGVGGECFALGLYMGKVLQGLGNVLVWERTGSGGQNLKKGWKRKKRGWRGVVFGTTCGACCRVRGNRVCVELIWGMGRDGDAGGNRDGGGVGEGKKERTKKPKSNKKRRKG